MKNKISAFTLAETLIVIVVLAIIMMITVLSTFNFDKAREKKILSLSQSFYTNIQNTYLQILFKYSTNGSITGLTDKNGDGDVDSKDLRDYFLKHIDGEETPCSDLSGKSEFATNNFENAECAMFSPDIVAGFYLDDTCSLEVYTKEYLSDSHNPRIIENACGRVVYGLRDSKGEFTYDLFTIALGKSNVR